MAQYLPNQGAPFTASSVSAKDGSQTQVMASSLFVPMHDEEVIDEALAPATTVITYKLDGVSVATKTITVAGTTTTIKVDIIP